MAQRIRSPSIGHGNIYAFKATRTQQGSLPSGDAADVEEISPTGKRIRSFSTTFRVGGQRRYLQVDGLAVTPGGHDVLVVGNVSKSLSGLVDSRPYLAEYSASSGAFLRGKGFDGDETRLGTGVAVDPTGQHVYVGDERNPFVGRTTARIYEFDVASLHQVRRFTLAGNDVCCDLAVTPDGHLFAQVGPPHSTQVLLQEYSSTGGYENQFASPPGGLAVGPTGDVFVGSRTEHRIDRLSRTGKLLETLGAGHFTGLPVAAAVNRNRRRLRLRRGDERRVGDAEVRARRPADDDHVSSTGNVADPLSDVQVQELACRREA